MSSLAIHLRVLRAEKRISQESVAQAIGLSRAAYNEIENDKITPSLQTVIALATFFDVSIDYLLGRTEKRH